MSIGEFFSMGGYGFYIWVSYGTTILLLLIEVIVLKRQRRTILQRLGRIKRLKTEKANEAQT